VKAIAGEYREFTGQLLSIDGCDGVVKLDCGNVRMQSNIIMLQMNFLCKVPKD